MFLGVALLHDPEIVCLDEPALISDPCLRVIREEGLRSWIAFRAEEISPAEAASLIIRDGGVRDLTIQEPAIEETIREFSERQ